MTDRDFTFYDLGGRCTLVDIQFGGQGSDLLPRRTLLRI
jgi:hypothetical protein